VRVYRDLVGRYVETSALADTLGQQLVAIGTVTATGRPRSILNAYLQVLDRQHRLALTLGLQRVARYDNVKIFGPTRTKLHTERRINEAEAAVVRRIFDLCAAGKGVKTIAKILNAEGAPTPQPINRQLRGWAASSMRAVVYRRTYLGEIVYAATKPCDS
jgi:Recombinase